MVPYDRRAAEELRLPFYAIESRRTPRKLARSRGRRFSSQFAPREAISAPTWPRCISTRSRSAPSAARFAACSIRSTACRPIWTSIRTAAGEFSAAAAALSATEMARVGWPSLPAGVLVDEIRDWWDASRQEWSRRIHGFYRVLGRGVTWPVRAAWDAVAGPQSDPLAAFQQQERAAIVLAVEKLLDELDRLAQVGNDTLRPRLLQLLGGHARATLLDRVQTAHENLPAVDEHYRAFLRGRTGRLADGRIRGPCGFCNRSTTSAALARPAITVALFFTGLHFAGDLAGQAAAHAAGATAGQLATEAAIAGGITGGGEALVSTTSEGVRQAAGRLFSRLQSRYAQQRARWLAEWLERELLGDLLADLRRGAEVPEGKEFLEVESTVAALSGESSQE